MYVSMQFNVFFGSRGFYKGNDNTKKNVIKSMCLCVYTHVCVKRSSRVILPVCDLSRFGLSNFFVVVLSPIKASSLLP